MAQEGGGKHSGKLMGLRFMQRAVEKRKLEEAVAKAQEADVEDPPAPSQGTADAPAPKVEQREASQTQAEEPSTSGRRAAVVVTYEPTPLPGASFTAACGRMSFRGSNVVIEELQQQRMGAAPKPKPPPPTEPQAGVAVTDIQMASSIAFQKPAELKPWKATWTAPTQLKIIGEEPAAKAEGKQKKPKKDKSATQPANENAFAPLRPAKKPKPS